MDTRLYVKPDFPDDAFAGTAEYYAKYRVPYPKALLDDLIERAGITLGARLLDIACGPGRVAIPLASAFESVVAVDLESEMIEVGKKVANDQGVAHISWIVGRAKNLEIEPASVQLITIGEAFHRLDQLRIATRALRWLSPGCCLVALGVNRGTEPWRRIVQNIVHKWTFHDGKKGGSSVKQVPGSGQAHYERVLKDTGYKEVGTHTFVHSQDWTIESIIGYLYSTSFCSKRVLGANVELFEKDLYETLIAYDVSGVYQETMEFGYTLGKKPY